jgi:hypothetical protein
VKSDKQKISAVSKYFSIGFSQMYEKQHSFHTFRYEIQAEADKEAQ